MRAACGSAEWVLMNKNGFAKPFLSLKFPLLKEKQTYSSLGLSKNH